MYIKENKIKEIIKEVVSKILQEGIDIDSYNNIISFNPSHEDNVDTSLENNPTYNTDFGDDVKVWSIFKRKDGFEKLDGNPLLYAMKGEEHWRFKSNRDKNAVYSQIDKILNKFANQFQGGVAVLIPSGNELNKMFASQLQSKIKGCMLLDDVLIKLTTVELMDIIMKPNSHFKQYYRNRWLQAKTSLEGYIKNMDRRRSGKFSRHFVKDHEMRNVIDTTLRLSDDAYAKYANVINGQDVLLLDDSISHGQTLKEAINVIKESYSPKSISVLTLFSKKYPN